MQGRKVVKVNTPKNMKKRAVVTFVFVTPLFIFKMIKEKKL